MNKKLLIAVCAVILILPTIIAIVAYNAAQASPVTDNSVTKMIVNAPDGNSYVFDRASDVKPEEQIDGDMIKYFTSLSSGAKTITIPSGTLTASSRYDVIYTSYSKDTKYEYYFSTDSEEAYYKDANGNTYKIRSENAEKFISSPYGAALYNSAKVPTLMLSGTQVIKPSTMSWKYALENGNYCKALADTDTSSPTLQISGALNLVFDIEPDTLHVQIYNGETEIFNDLYANIANADFTESASLKVTVQAKWYEIETRMSSGEAVYNFNVDVNAPAIFYLGEPEIEQGEFVVISAKNVDDPTKIVFTSVPELKSGEKDQAFTPVFFKDGNYVRALVPISYQYAYSPNYTFTLAYGDISTTLTLAVTEKKFKSQSMDASSNLIATTRNGTTLQAFTDTMAPYFENQENERYFTANTPFNYPTASSSIKSGFGIYRTITVTSTTYRHEGVDYIISAGSQVNAVAPGKVIYAGQTSLSGRTVVIDHGFGLKTLYAHLNTASVTEGTIVAAGDAIGVTGDTGFTVGGVLHFGMYIFDVPVCPYDIVGTGVNGVHMQE